MSYVGSKISVTTDSGNKYEGVLTAVNANEKTIEVQMVRLVAQQGKPVPNGPSYEFVVFKSDDIKDLEIYEAGSQERKPRAPPAYSDPAIVSSKPSSSSTVSSASTTSLGSGKFNTDWLEPEMPVSSKAPGRQSYQFGTGNYQQSTPVSFGSIAQHQSRRGEAAAPLPTHSGPVKVESYAHSLVVNTENAGVTGTPTTFAAAATAAPTFSPNRPHQQAQQRQQSSTQKIRSYSTATKRTTSMDVPAGQQQPPSAYYYPSSQNRNPQHQQQRQQYQSPRGPVIPNAEFDFERSNQHYDKEQVAAQVAPVLSGEGPFYNRTTSFFDTISSEATPAASVPEGERSRTERSWNIETFGAPYVRGNGGGGGGSGSGGSRGGRGGSQGYGHRGGKSYSIHRNATGSFQQA